MSILNKVKKLATDNDAILVDHNGDTYSGSRVWELWLPNGVKWVESGSRVLCQTYGNSDQSWKREAYRELLESVESGIE